MQTKPYSAILSILLLVGCASSGKIVSHPPVVEEPSFAVSRPIPFVLNERVEDWIRYYQGRGRDRFKIYLARSGRYIPMMQKVLRSYGLPEDLVFLAMIESGFNPRATSRARAVGLWQFMTFTGRRYDLKVGRWVDERRDPEKSTVAAAKYLRDLYQRYGDWHLAAAAYNAGEGKVDRAIARQRTRDYWELARARYLKRETRDFVPKLIAAALISKNPRKYGFSSISYESPLHSTKVPLETPTDLRVAGRLADVSFEEMRKLNPELKFWVTPPGDSYQLKIPERVARRFLERYEALSPVERFAEKIYEAKERTTLRHVAKVYGIPLSYLAELNGYNMERTLSPGQTVLIPHSPPEGESYRGVLVAELQTSGDGGLKYRVQKGDSLWLISQRLGMSRSTLKSLNPHVAWEHLRYGRTISLVTVGGGRRSVARRPQDSERTATANLATPPPEAAPGVVIHQIRDGETLWDIARKYKVTVRQLKEWNDVRDHRRIQPGQSLKVLIPSQPPTGEA